nr:uncharacterized protein LOC114827424 [Malus domestica]
MAECIYDIDEPDDLPENPELVEFLCAEPNKPPPEVQDPLEVIDLGTEEDPRPIQISGLLGVEDRARIICLLQEFKDCFAWHYTEMPGLDPAFVEHRMPIKEGYEPIKMAPDDIHKIAFRCPSHVGAYKYLVMPFGLKNAGATYQRAMNAIFHDLIGQSMEVYIDDIVVKSKTEEQHLRGVEVNKNKSRAILESPPPINKVQLQRLLGKINFLRRFIANLAGKIQPLTPLLRLKDKENFEWGPTHQQAFDSIKAYLTSPPVLVPPQMGKPLKLYISASEKSIGSLLAQNNEGGKEQAVYYLSRILTEPMLAGRIGKWILALSEFSFQYVPQRAIKGQAIADFLTEHQEPQNEVINIPGSLEVTSVWIPSRSDVSGEEDWIQQEIRRVTGLWITPWKLYFDGSHTQKAAGAGIVIINPQGVNHYYSFLLDYQGNTNNRAEYEALIIGLEILMDLGATEVEIFGDSELVINQLNGEFKCRHITMAGYYMAATQLLSFWESEISVNHVPRGSNLAANEMA